MEGIPLRDRSIASNHGITFTQRCVSVLIDAELTTFATRVQNRSQLAASNSFVNYSLFGQLSPLMMPVNTRPFRALIASRVECRLLQQHSVLCLESVKMENKKLSYRRETARQLRIHAQLTRCFSAVAV